MPTTLVLISAFAAGPAFAQVDPLGSELSLPSPGNTDSNVAPAVASDPLGNIVAVWQRLSGGTYQIVARLFDPDGTPLGAEIPVNVTVGACQRFPAVARDGQGNFFVAWQRESGGGSDIAGRKFDAAGSPLSGELTINSTSGLRTRPAVAAAPGGQLLVVWQSQGQDGNGWGVYGQNLTAANPPVRTGLSEFLINHTTTGAQHSPAIVFTPTANATPRFAVVWQSAGGPANGIFLRLVDGAGVAQSGEIQVNTTTTAVQGAPKLAADGSGNIVAVWQSTGQETTGSGSGIFLRRFTAGGAALSGELQVNATTQGDQREPAVASDDAGNFLVTWTSGGQDGSGLGVFGVGVDRRLFATGGEMQLYSAASASGDQHAPALAASVSGRLFAAWQSDIAPPLVQGRVLQLRGAGFYTLTPCRLYDSRDSGHTILAAGESRSLDFTGECGVPATAAALSLNVTIVTPAATGTLAMLPADAPLVTTSTVSYNTNVNRSNNAVVSLARDGTVRLRAVTTQQTHLVIDVDGYFQ